MRSEQADDNDDNRAGKHGDVLLRERQERTEKQRADNRGGRIDMLYEDIWHIAGHHIAEKSPAHAGNHADEYSKKDRWVVGNLEGAHCAGNRKDAKANGVGKQHDAAAALQKATHLRDEDDETGDKCRQCVNRILEHCRRKCAEDDIADDSAADRDGEGEHKSPENILSIRSVKMWMYGNSNP